MCDKLSSVEKETIIIFNEAENSATIETFNSKLKKRLQKLSEEYPDVRKIEFNGSDGAERYEFPKAWIRINGPKKLSDEERMRRSERMKSLASNKNAE